MRERAAGGGKSLNLREKATRRFRKLAARRSRLQAANLRGRAPRCSGQGCSCRGQGSGGAASAQARGVVVRGSPLGSFATASAGAATVPFEKYWPSVRRQNDRDGVGSHMANRCSDCSAHGVRRSHGRPGVLLAGGLRSNAGSSSWLSAPPPAECVTTWGVESWSSLVRALAAERQVHERTVWRWKARLEATGEAIPVPGRPCPQCGQPLPRDATISRVYCSRRCRARARRARAET